MSVTNATAPDYCFLTASNDILIYAREFSRRCTTGGVFLHTKATTGVRYHAHAPLQMNMSNSSHSEGGL